jgi:Ca2+-transporting ATPase
MRAENWHNLNTKEVLRILKSSQLGLSTEEAERRIKKYGRNELPERRRFTQLDVLLNQLKSSLVYVLLIAALITFCLRIS